MSLALYRKYRPATFAEVKGQEHVTEPLRQALRAGRVNHAYLFSGPRGCGKTSSARILARSLNCEKGPTPDPCGECESCVALGPTGPGHIDVIEIDAASHGGVDDARELRERAFFAPVSGRFKVYIIDEAHMVTREGFNALLKLVEEPPPHLKFIFATTEPEKVIGTIRSRTHHYPFRLIPPAALQDLLAEILDTEGVSYEAEALALVVRAGAGSARDSESILDQLLAGSADGGITYDRAVALLGYTEATLLDEVVEAFGRRDGGAVFRSLDRVIEGGNDPRRFAADLLERLRDLVVLASVPDAPESGLLARPADELARMRKQVEALGAAELTRAAEIFNAGLTEMRGATSPRLLLELMCARALLPAAYSDEASLLARLERLERGGVSAPPATQEPSSGAGRASAPAASAPPSAPPPPARTAPAPGERTASAERPDRTAPAERTAAAESPAAAERTTQAERSAPPEPPAERAAAAVPSRSAATQGSGGAPAASGTVDAGAVRQSWDHLLEKVKAKRRVAWMILINDVKVAGVDDRTLTLAFARDGDMKGFASSGSDAVVAAAMKDTFGGDWRVVAVPGGGSGGPGGGSGGRPPGRPSAPTGSAAVPQAESPGGVRNHTGEEPGPPQGARARADAAWGTGGSSGSGRGVPMDADEIDPDDDVAPPTQVESGLELIQRELGGQIIAGGDRS